MFFLSYDDIIMSRTSRKDFYEFDSDKKRHWDKKKRYKASSTAKRITKAQERAKNKDALRHILEKEDEEMPINKKHNDWDWT